MSLKDTQQQRFLEVALVLICVALCCLLHTTGAHGMVVLHLFYLPVLLAAFFLGRYRAGVLALLCAIGGAVVLALDVTTLSAAVNFPLVMWLTLAIWSAVLGLAAILTGTLSDERTAKITELHDAYVGVLEVLSRYLNSADPKANDQATRVSLLSRKVAVRMGLPDKEADNIRVAALLQDINDIEVTARVIRKAVGDLKLSARANTTERTFPGSDLVCSLGAVLTGAWPLLLDQRDCLGQTEKGEGGVGPATAAVGASIIRTVSRYVNLLGRQPPAADPRDAIDALREDLEGDHSRAVVGALEWVVLHSAEATSNQAAAELVAAGAGDEF
jgi:hypothetical protein